jgi:hypothetical protein
MSSEGGFICCTHKRLLEKKQKQHDAKIKNEEQKKHKEKRATVQEG